MRRQWVLPREAFPPGFDDKLHAGENVALLQESAVTSAMRYVRGLFGEEKRDAFVYPNNWLSNTNRCVACKEADANATILRPHHVRSPRYSRDPCFTIILVIAAIIALNIVASRFLVSFS